MKTRLLLVFSILLTIISGCFREKHTTLSGRLLENCAGEPRANSKVSLYRSGYDGYMGEKLGETTTDANGNFAIPYTYKRHKSMVLLAGGQKLRGISMGTSSVGDIIIQRAAKSVVRVKVNNAHASEDDAINVRYSGPPYFTMHTPFHDTVFPVYEYMTTLEPPYWNANHPSTVMHSVSWSFTNGLFPDSHSSIDVEYCNAVPDTLVIIIN
jgi:hypothetical protein